MHFKVCSKFYYSKLNDSSKKVYEKILDGWLNYKETITISGFYGKVNFQEIIKFIYDDNPELFYIDYNRVSVMLSPFSSSISMRMLYPIDQCEHMKQKIAEVISKVQKLAHSDSDKEKIAHEYIVRNIKYSENIYAVDAHSIKGALIDGTAVCEGYARAFKLLCDAMEVPNVVVNGSASDSNGNIEKHAWNIIRRNNNNYHVDSTWNCVINNSSGIYLYYNVPDDHIAKDHNWQRGIVPVCSDASEMDRLISPVVGKKSLKATLEKAIQAKKTVCAVRFNRRFESTGAILSMINEVLSSVTYRVPTLSVSYNATLDCAIIWMNH